ncbi:putative membrane associated signaling protein [Aliivibrio wodanis]|uniref:diguanylate cyclase n=1 Tax=Aliivibrio wodanis TaxID=80852 RepID=A0A090KKZ3_9GAMM|nr:putative membrane associated signaling protein [Aliivibrio wodanis]
MDGFSLDIRTLNFIIILFSLIYCIGLLLFQFTQQTIRGLSTFAMSIFVIGTGPLMLSLRGDIPDWLSIVGANILIAFGFHLSLYSLSLFRKHSLQYTHFSSLMMFVTLISLIYFTYYIPSIKYRIIIISLYMVFVTLSTAIVVLKGKNDDLVLATRMMALSFAIYGGFMIFRIIVVLPSLELTNFMTAGLIHQLTFLFSIVLIVSMSFIMLWMINARLLNSIHILSYHDPLTTLKNRRALEKMVPNMMQEVKTTPISIIMTDIDKFKLINDQHGHIIGDRVIKMVAESIKNSLNSSDSAFRFGGDEIMILLPDSHAEKAKEMANELRQSISKITIDGSSELSLTSSFGVAQLSSFESWEECVDRADKALYQAKSNGRNRVAICPQT